MKERKSIYDELLPQIKNPTLQKTTILFYHVFSLKMSNNFVYSKAEQFAELIEFLNNENV